MKKFLLILVVLSLIGCSNPVVEEPEEVFTFEDAVQEVYEMTGKTLFYSKNGIYNTVGGYSKATSPNEIPGVCTDYAIEFAYYWNEVKNYDNLFGKAYFAWVQENTSILNIMTGNFVKNGTSNLREDNNNFQHNTTLQEIDGVYRDVIVTSIIYTGKNILHYGRYYSGHIWIVIKVGNDWYDTDPDGWDNISDYDFPPYKITF